MRFGASVSKHRGEQDDMIPYSAAFRSRMVARLVGPNAITATALGKETGLHQATLSRWLKEAFTLERNMARKKSPPPAPPPKQPQEWMPEEKLAIVLEASSLSEGELGVYLRSKGIHEAVLEEWRRQALAGIRGTERASKQQTESRRVRELERELRRKEKALAEAAALLILKKKAQEIWGDEDDDTGPKSDE
jgi:transposase